MNRENLAGNGSMQTIGWIGVGHMGEPMALRLLQAGYAVHAYNRNAEKTIPLAAAGATIQPSPQAVVQAAEICFLSLSDANAVRSVLTQEQGVLAAIGPGKVLVNMSTIAPEDSRAFAQAVAARGGRYVDAPVSGSIGAAKGGQLLILAGGEAAAIDACRPCLAILGKDTLHFGANGSGSSAKLAINLLLGIVSQGLGEALLLAETLGIDKDQMLELIGKSALNSPFFQFKKELYRTNDFPAAFKVALLAKDLGLITAEAERQQLVLPLAEAAHATCRRAEKHGKAQMDMAAVYLELKEGSRAGAKITDTPLG